MDHIIININLSLINSLTQGSSLSADIGCLFPDQISALGVLDLTLIND